MLGPGPDTTVISSVYNILSLIVKRAHIMFVCSKGILNQWKA